MLLSATTLRTDYLTGLNVSDSASVSMLERALARAEAAVAKYLGYPGPSPTWASTSYTLRLAARRFDSNRLTLPVAPVTAVSRRGGAGGLQRFLRLARRLRAASPSGGGSSKSAQLKEMSPTDIAKPFILYAQVCACAALCGGWRWWPTACGCLRPGPTGCSPACCAMIATNGAPSGA